MNAAIQIALFLALLMPITGHAQEQETHEKHPAQIQAELDREVVGIGLQITINDDGKCEVKSLMKGTPVATADRIKPGDIVAAIANAEGKLLSTNDMELIDIVKLLRGKAETEVDVRFKSADGKTTIRTKLKRVKMTLVDGVWGVHDSNAEDADE